MHSVLRVEGSEWKRERKMYEGDEAKSEKPVEAGFPEEADTESVAPVTEQEGELFEGSGVEVEVEFTVEGVLTFG
jgi:hypothetical protein